MKEKRVKDSVTDLDRLFKSKRSIYSKLDSNQQICLSVLRKLVRSYEKGAQNFDEYFKKAKAFGLSTKFFNSEFSANAFNFLHNKSYKNHQSRSTNDALHKLYYKFELGRKRAINSCYDLKKSDEQVVKNICYFMNLPNPFKCLTRGKKIPDIESQEYSVECIDYKGESYGF